MTSAARPTFLPAIGGHSLRDTGAGPVTMQSAKDLAAHTKLKFRQKGQFSKDEMRRIDLKAQLQEKEQAYFQKIKSSATLSTNVEEKFIEFQNLDKDDTDEDDDGRKCLTLDDDDEEEDEDDTAELMKELEKIKQERRQEQERIEREQLEQEEREAEERAMTGNPLLNESTLGGSSFTIKRRWDDDVIFKNQSRGVVEAPKKRFINDMLRSDFHRKFMDKYVK
ncbi:hypothetical protein HDV04_000215 [Boothiomyces sp. JEL0838]|nr:hypothetical protein HDV04_000215 [Boothiomyces sp. JEL0838]